MIKKMEERSKAKTTSIKENKRINNKLGRETDESQTSLYGCDMWWNNGQWEERKIWYYAS